MCSSMEVVLFVLNCFGKYSNFKMGSFWDIPETKPKDFHGTFLEEIHGIFRRWFIKHLLRIFSRGCPQDNLLISFGRLGVFICSVFINFCFVCFFLWLFFFILSIYLYLVYFVVFPVLFCFVKAAVFSSLLDF